MITIKIYTANEEAAGYSGATKCVFTPAEPNEHLADIAGSLHAIEAEAFNDPWSESGLLGSLMNDSYCFVLAEDEAGRVAGYIGCYFTQFEGNITRVAVKSSFKRQGIARRLVKALSDYAAYKKVSEIFLEVRQSNEPAKELYKKSGFEELGVRRNFYQNPKEDAIIMKAVVNTDVN